MVDLTKAQQRVLARLQSQWRARGSQPNLSDVAKALDMHYVSLKQHLAALDTKGYLSFEAKGRGKPPLIRLTQRARGIPLVGEITAGGLIATDEHLEGYLSIPGRPDVFALRVRGDSMSEPIQDGDVVLLRKAEPRSGDICALRHEDETTLKYLDLLTGGEARLRPHNPAYPQLKVRLSEIVVAGVLDALLRGSIVDSLFQEAVN